MILPGRQISVQICETPSHRARGRARGFLRAGSCGSRGRALLGSLQLLGKRADRAGLCSPVDERPGTGGFGPNACLCLLAQRLPPGCVTLETVTLSVLHGWRRRERRQESSWEFPAPCGWRAVRQAPGWGVRVIVSCVCAQGCHVQSPPHTPQPHGSAPGPCSGAWAHRGLAWCPSCHVT